MENTIILTSVAHTAQGGLNPDVVSKNVDAMYPNSLLLGKRELSVAVCRFYDLGMDYPDFIDSESIASFFGGLSYIKLSGEGKRYDFIDGEHANVEVLVDVFTDPTYVEENTIADTKRIIIADIKAKILDGIKDTSLIDDITNGLDLVVHEVIPAEIIDEITATDATPGSEFKTGDSVSAASPVARDPMSMVSESGYPVIDLISEYVAGSSGRGNDLFNNPNPGLYEAVITPERADSLSRLTTPKVENVKMNWSSASKSTDTIKSRIEAEKLLKLQ